MSLGKGGSHFHGGVLSEILGMGLKVKEVEDCLGISSERRASFQISVWLYPIQFKLWNVLKLSESLPHQRIGALGWSCSL